MVRRITGVLVEVGRKKKSINDVALYLNEFSNEPARYTAPPSGLFLENVFYDERLKNDTFDPIIKIMKFLK